VLVLYQLLMQGCQVLAASLPPNEGVWMYSNQNRRPPPEQSMLVLGLPVPSNWWKGGRVDVVWLRRVGSRMIQEGGWGGGGR
jgi:hypothetical protein